MKDRDEVEDRYFDDDYCVVDRILAIQRIKVKSCTHIAQIAQKKTHPKPTLTIVSNNMCMCDLAGTAI